MPQPIRVAIVGSGGNIGSHLYAHVARMPMVAAMTLVDPDIYARSNVAGQNIDRSSVGLTKVAVQADAIRRIRPAICVQPIAARVEQVPLGAFLGCDLLLSCLDSRLSRQYCNEISWRLGIPLVDAGVLGSQSLARVGVYAPSDAANCMECAWGAEDYANLELAYPCRFSGRRGVHATNAPSYLGALAAALQAAECFKLLSGQHDHSLIGKQLIVGSWNSMHCVVRQARNLACRFDHKIWRIEEPDEPLLHKPIGGLLLEEGARISVAFGRFALRRNCGACGRSLPVVRFFRDQQSSRGRCSSCGKMCDTSPFDWADSLSAVQVARHLAGRTLAATGLRDGDILTHFTPDRVRHLVLRDPRTSPDFTCATPVRAQDREASRPCENSAKHIVTAFRK